MTANGRGPARTARGLVLRTHSTPPKRPLPVARTHRFMLPLLATLVLLGTFAFTPDAQAVTSGRWKGGDIEFRVSQNRIKRLSVVAVHTCQAVGTGEFFNELQRFTPPGRFAIRPSGRFLASRYVSRVNDYFDVRFAWKGRIRGRRMSARAQTSYKYYAYYGDYGYRLTSCYSERIFRARPRG